jgi:adenylate cyclase
MNKRIPIIIGIFLIMISVWMQITTVDYVRLLIVRLDNLAYDMQLRTKLFTHKTRASYDVIIIDVDDKSLLQEGRWPWPRGVIGKLLDRLQEEGVVVVAMDMMFPEKEIDVTTIISDELQKRNLQTPALSALLDTIAPDLNNDSLLAASFQGKDSVLGMTFLPHDEITGLLPPPALRLTSAELGISLITGLGYISNIPQLQTAAKNAGFINVYADPDGIIRRVPVVMRYKDYVYPSLAFQAVSLYLLSKPSLVTASYANTEQLEAVQLGDHVVPTDSYGQVLVPFIGKSYTFPYYSAADILNKKTPPNALAGKIAFLGTSATGLGDLRATAIQGVYPGVEIQASIAQGILDNSFSYRPAWAIGAEIFLAVVLGIIFAIIFPFCGPRSTALLTLIVPVLLIFLNNWLWLKTGLILFVLIPILLIIILALLNMIYGYVFETRKRERIKSMFGQYVPEEHIDEMLKTSGTFSLHGEDREMTVLFADIRNFTSISEPMTASELKDMLNQFFTPMTEIIFKHHGTIDKYIGDLIMAFWGAPLKDKRHAQHAIAAALEMQKAALALKPAFDKRGWPEIKIGVGLNSGLMSVGDMGSTFRRNYTVLGDSVNLASRVEGLTKFYGVNTIVTENTCKNQTRFLFRRLDQVRVKGKKLGITIVEVVSTMATASPALISEMKQSDAALEKYLQQHWDVAEQQFQDLHTRSPETKIYKIYLERISEFKKNPPPADWDGIYAHASK